MTELHDRLVRCFASAFPTLSEKEILAANVALLSDLDSLAGVTLVTLIHEEFGVDVDLEELLELGTFEAIQEFLREHRSSHLPSTRV